MTAPAPTDQAELLALLTLRFTPGLGPLRIEALRRHFGRAEAALAAPLTRLREVPGLDTKTVSAIGSPAPAEQARTELERARRARVRLLGRGLDGYPPALEALSDPPAVLWARGPEADDLAELRAVPRSVGIVGTRGASPHALSLTRTLAGELAHAGVVVVSGLARGVDTAAHQGAVDAGGVSLAVLGSAVDVIYPRENAPLARQLTLLSEYPLGTGPNKPHFPMRNRLIAALSAGVLVVEGERKSGSLITATHALDCGRTVFAVPGRAGDPRASGPHALIRDGAVLTESAGDILAELGWAQAASPPLPDLPPEQESVLRALSAPATLDDLHAATGLALPELQTALVMLQLQGLAQEVGGRWAR
ncbi:DNA-processing protein DprA [Deinococcus reticulitermitis]|uniref:DNA-processing protein DprA n=1 Tax=Deinococcus reticulitermitis TaxID=856736 RepID=UPI000B82627F|nr:DNA-processing protein DprA [Deinococcus reticulitermitis]